MKQICKPCDTSWEQDEEIEAFIYCPMCGVKLDPFCCEVTKSKMKDLNQKGWTCICGAKV